MIKRTGVSKYTGLLVAKSETNWTSKALLALFVEQEGLATVFVLHDEAAKQFGACESWRIYDMEILGKCVKSNDCKRKYGVNNSQEVVLKFPCKNLSFSKEAWPSKILCLPFEDSFTHQTRQTIPSSRSKSELNGSRECSLLNSRSMLSQRLPSWAASPPVGRCSLGDSFNANISFVIWP